MYFPYLRGKQFELLALREFANQNANNNTIIPIIEPVKDTFNTLRIAVDCFFTNNRDFCPFKTDKRRFFHRQVIVTK